MPAALTSANASTATGPAADVKLAPLAPGWRSTEFQITVGLILCFVAGACKGLLPPDHAAGFAAAVGAIYKALRFFLKLQNGQLNADAVLAEIDAQSGIITPSAGPDANSQPRAANLSTTNETAAEQTPAARPVPNAPGASMTGDGVVSADAAQAPEMARKPDGSPDYGMLPPSVGLRAQGFAQPRLLAALSLSLLAAFTFEACTTDSAGKLVGRPLTAGEKQALNVVGTVVLEAAVSAADSYAQTGKVNGGAVAAGALNGAAYGLRSMESTPQAGDPAAIAATLQSTSGNAVITSQVTPAVQGSVAKAAQSGVPPSAALEAAAVALDAAVARKAGPPPVTPAPVAPTASASSAGGHWGWQEDGRIWIPDVTPASPPPAIAPRRLSFRVHAALRDESDVPESWRRTLYDGPRIITPIWTAGAREPFAATHLAER